MEDILTSQSFNLTSQLATSRGEGVAIIRARDDTLLDANEKYLTYLREYYIKREKFIGEKITEIFSQP